LVKELLDILYRCKPNKELDDEWVWKGNYSCHYTVIDAYNKLNSKNHRVWKRLSISCGKLRTLPPLCYAGGGFSMTGCLLGIG